MPRGGDLYGWTRHFVVRHAGVRRRICGCVVGEEGDGGRIDVVVGEEDVVAVELVGSGELGKKILGFGVGEIVVIADGSDLVLLVRVRVWVCDGVVARRVRSADGRAFSAAFASTGRVERRRRVS